MTMASQVISEASVSWGLGMLAFGCPGQLGHAFVPYQSGLRTRHKRMKMQGRFTAGILRIGNGILGRLGSETSCKGQRALGMHLMLESCFKGLLLATPSYKITSFGYASGCRLLDIATLERRGAVEAGKSHRWQGGKAQGAVCCFGSKKLCTGSMTEEGDCQTDHREWVSTT